jgi:RNA polymerase sigma-70 factor (ECF subfamily)
MTHGERGTWATPVWDLGRASEQNPEGNDVGRGHPTDEKRAVVEQRIYALHSRLLAGDRVASEELGELLLGPVLARLERRWQQWAYTDVLYDAVVDVFLDYIDAPERYDSSQGSLMGWLELAAHRDVTNIYRSRKQRLLHDTPPLSALGVESVSSGELPGRLSVVGMARIGPDPDNVDRLDNLHVWSRIREACPDERERELIWAVWVEHETSWERLALIIGAGHLPLDRRRRKVKNKRDIARRKLLRMGLIDDGHD